MSADSSEVRITNETTGGEKGQKLDRFDLIPAGPMRQVARHYGVGAQKYEDRNWERGYDWSLSIGALERHLNAFKRGEDIDEETESPHLAAVVFHALALLEFAETHPELDDRPTTVAARKMVEEAVISWRSVIHIPSVELRMQGVSEDTLSLFFGAKAVKASKGTHSLTIERTEPQWTVGQKLKKEDYPLLPVGSRVFWWRGNIVVEKRADGFWYRDGLDIPHADAVGDLVDSWRVERVGYGDSRKPGEFRLGDRVRHRNAGNITGTIVGLTSDRDLINVCWDLGSGPNGSLGDRVLEALPANLELISSQGPHLHIERRVEPPEPKYQVGDRASVRDIMKALDDTPLSFESDPYLTIERLERDGVVFGGEGLHGDTVSILNALEDAGFQVTKA